MEFSPQSSQQNGTGDVLADKSIENHLKVTKKERFKYMLAVRNAMAGDVNGNINNSLDFTRLSKDMPDLYAKILGCARTYINQPQDGIEEMQKLVPEYDEYAQQRGVRPIGTIDHNFFQGLLLYIKDCK